jgi:hypothetical protein
MQAFATLTKALVHKLAQVAMTNHIGMQFVLDEVIAASSSSIYCCFVLLSCRFDNSPSRV